MAGVEEVEEAMEVAEEEGERNWAPWTMSGDQNARVANSLRYYTHFLI